MAAALHPIFDNVLEALLLCSGCIVVDNVGTAIFSSKFDSVSWCLVSDGPLEARGLADREQRFSPEL